MNTVIVEIKKKKISVGKETVNQTHPKRGLLEDIFELHGIHREGRWKIWQKI